MYSRYVPQNDGTYRRSRLPDQIPTPPATPPPPEHPRPCPPPEPPKSPPPPRPRPRPCREPENPGILTFLRQLLPRDFDSGDLLVIVLLLLISGDCREDQNTALLTLALYLFL